MSDDIVQVKQLCVLAEVGNPFQVPSRFSSAISTFIAQNKNPASSPNYASVEADNYGPILKLLSNEKFLQNLDFALSILHVIVLLTRKESNRYKFGSVGFQAILPLLKPGSTNSLVLAEVANIILNVCYEADNVIEFIHSGGFPSLISCLGIDDLQVQINASGAIQSICFQEEGKSAIQQTNGIQSLASLLSKDDQRLLIRVTGSLHNISSDPNSVAQIVECHIVQLLLSFLTSKSDALVISSIGTLQNMCCTPEGKAEIKSVDGFEQMLRLCVHPSNEIVSSAVGGVFNLLRSTEGEELEGRFVGKQWKRLVGLLVTLGAVHSLLFPNKRCSFDE
ncbi:hypothetical protein BLNAU_6567 [Blattamonas nauphoetae]|uniref:Uncharacterized protein n=1 Tax=Blattamonas nauphoetae TaxID=2049346 RepID=A0ABQ9Y461_9EUKA|nr:hypothetical protein BLNAU_6567 [Blattamonas nauphoetae]